MCKLNNIVTNTVLISGGILCGVGILGEAAGITMIAALAVPTIFGLGLILLGPALAPMAPYIPFLCVAGFVGIVAGMVAMVVLIAATAFLLLGSVLIIGGAGLCIGNISKRSEV